MEVVVEAELQKLAPGIIRALLARAPAGPSTAPVRRRHGLTFGVLRAILARADADRCSSCQALNEQWSGYIRALGVGDDESADDCIARVVRERVRDATEIARLTGAACADRLAAAALLRQREAEWAHRLETALHGGNSKP